MQATIHKFITDNALFMQQLENEGGADAFIADAETLSAEPCPCCGSQPSAKLEPSLSALSVRIVCPVCAIQTKHYLTGKNVIGQTFTAKDQLREALATWNRRKEGVKA